MRTAHDPFTPSLKGCKVPFHHYISIGEGVTNRAVGHGGGLGQPPAPMPSRAAGRDGSSKPRIRPEGR